MAEEIKEKVATGTAATTKKKKEETVVEESKTETTTTEKTPIDITIDENTQSFIKGFFEKYVSGNSTYKSLFFFVLIIVVLAAAVLSYFGYITPDTFKGILDTFLNLFSEPESAVNTVSYLVDKVNFIG